MSKQQATIKDIARKLRVSVSTVSRALRNLPDVNPETKKAVQELAKQLNYEPNYIAQSLINRKSRIIGVIVPVISAPVFGRILTGMHDAAQRLGYQLMICQSNESSESEASLVRQLIAFKVDGLVISVSGETKDAAAFEVLAKKEIPVVFFDRVPPDIQGSRIIVDEYRDALAAVEHMIRNGCRRPAHLAGPPHLSISANRLNGYLAALKKHGLPVDEKLIIPCCRFEEDAEKAVRQLFSGKTIPDGLFAINDRSAIIAIRYLARKGIRIPEEVSVVGFNNDPISEVVNPSLTSVMQPGYEMGSLAVETVIRHLEDCTYPPQTITLTGKLVKRASSKRQAVPAGV